jgi:predicted permease
MKPLRYVFRRWALAPMFTIVALATLALGIGANTAIFSVVNGVLVKPLPYPQAQELVGVWHVAPGVSGIAGDVNCSPTMYFTYREENRTFQDFGLWSDDGVTVTGAGEPEQVRALDVTYGTLQALGVQPALGRWFSQADDTPGTPDSVILTYGYWQRRFGGSTSAIGRTLVVDSRPRTIIGVMRRDFRFLNSGADLILPERFDRSKIFLGNFSYRGIARLKAGVTVEQANTDVARMLSIWVKAWPPAPGISRTLFENARFGPKLQPLKKEVVGDIGPTLWVLMGTIGLVLLIACANVANLLLVRAESRQTELAVRAALGAGWGRIAREMLVESLTLGVMGGAVGLVLAYAAIRMLVAKGPATLPRFDEIAIDPLVLGFTLMVSLIAGLFFGLIPAIKYAGPNVIPSLHGGGRTMSYGRERHMARNTLVVVQVGLALVLLIGSGLLIRTFQALRNVRPGFTHPEEVQLLRISIPESQVKEPEHVMRMENEMINRLASLPGVASAAFASAAPLEGINDQSDLLYAQDKMYSAGQIPPIRGYRYVTPEFLKANGTSLIAGRDFTWTDIYETRHVAMVSENLAREMWGSPAAALGKRVRSGLNDAWREIVGVVGDVSDNGVDQKAPAFAYWPAMLDNFELEALRVTRFGVFVIRTKRAGKESFLAEARQAIWSVDPNSPIFLVRTLKDVYDTSMARTSLTLVLLGIAGAMALALGLLGIYGVIAYAVTKRTREIGIRMALGAQAAALLQMFVREGLLLAGLGALLGLISAVGLTRLMSSLLFKTTPLDPLTYSAVSVVLMVAATLASYVPARRATTLSPLEALRSE